MNKVLVTGAAGFIGSYLVGRLLSDYEDLTVVGMDNLNDYYDVSLKEYRLRQVAKTVEENPNNIWRFEKGDLSDKAFVEWLFSEHQFDVVVNMAAQAGVRNSINNPDAYIASNIVGFYNVLEACRHSCKGDKEGVKHFVYASSSSVYGNNAKVPCSVEDKVDEPVSLYAATKKSNELLAYSYSKLYGIPSTGLRFFTVYGPAGRPDMAYYSFTDKLLKGEKIQIFNYGDCRRDFTYIDDIVEGIVRVMQHAPEMGIGKDGLPSAPYSLYNIGNSSPEQLLDFVHILGEELMRVGLLSEDYNLDNQLELVPMQAGDVVTTFADVNALKKDFGFAPRTSLREGLRRFAEWYKNYYRL